MSEWTIHHGDVRKILKTLPDDYFDGVLSDPPYAYKFMGNRWDYALPSVNVWTELLRVVKPGAHALIFGGPRTFHRLAVNVEDAGFIPTDLLMYLHGKGFPKSLDIAKAIDKQAGKKRTKILGYTDSRLDIGSGASVSFKGASGRAANGLIPVMEPTTEAGLQWSGWGSALKPAYEPVLLAMKMLDGTFAENVQKWGTGALNIDGCRIGDEERHNPSASPVGMWDSVSGKEKDGRPPVGRWPANVVLNDVAAEMVDAASGDRPSTMTGRADPGKKHAHPADASRVRESMFGNERAGGSVYADAGGASRFFYTTKVSRGEREQGCDDLNEGPQGTDALRSGGRGEGKVKNTHPTLKSIDLTRWLATMLLPPPRKDGKPRRILVPFSGAGSEMIGCIQAGWDEVVGIEGEAEYIAIAKSRITKGGVFSGLLDKRMRTPKRERERASIGPARLRSVRP